MTSDIKRKCANLRQQIEERRCEIKDQRRSLKAKLNGGE